MPSLRRSLVAYSAFAAVALACALVLAASNPPYAHPSQAELLRPASVLLALSLGLVGVWLALRTPFGPHQKSQAAPTHVIRSLALGASLGAVAAVLDLVFGVSKATAAALGVASIHLPVPYSILVYAAGAVVVESLLRLFPFGLLAYVVHRLHPSGRRSAAVFAAGAALLSLLEPATQLSLLAGRTEVLVVFALFVYGYGLLASWQYWRAGPTAPILMRLGSYAVWHVTLGPLLAAA